MFLLTSHEVDHAQKLSKDSKDCQISQLFYFLFEFYFNKMQALSAPKCVLGRMVL